MAWIYLAASVESPWPYRPGSGRLPIVKKTATLPQFFFREWAKGNCRQHPFGMTYKPLPAICSRQLMSSTEDSLAKTSASRAAVRAWRESEADFLMKSSVLFAKLVRRLSFLKTCRPFVLADLAQSSEHLPIFGMTVAGRVYLPLNLEPRTYANVGSSWPTPKAADGTRTGMQTMFRYNERTGRKNLISEVAKSLWPTPRASDGPKGSPGQHGSKGDLTLSSAVHLWRTPTASLGSARGAVLPERRIQLGHSVSLMDQVGGQLNPTWVEWLMGYPSEWTALEDWVTPWFRPKRAKRSKD